MYIEELTQDEIWKILINESHRFGNYKDERSLWNIAGEMVGYESHPYWRWVNK